MTFFRAQESERICLSNHLGMFLVVLLFVYGAAARLVALTVRPFTPDESLFAVSAYRIAMGGGYHHFSGFHGPLLHYLPAGFFSLFGASDETVRLPWAFIGLVFLGLSFPLAQARGARVGLAFLALTALSPTYAFLSREVRGDTLILLLVCGCVFAALRRGPGAIIATLLFAAVAAATKMTGIIALGIAVVAAVIAAPRAVINRLRTLDRRELIAVGTAITVGVCLLVLLYTGFGAHPGNWNALSRAAAFWLNLQAHPTHPGSFWYFPGLLAVYEPLICILAFAAFGFFIRDPWCRFLALFFVGSLAFYGWAQEKVPNLVLYPLLPATLLAAEALGSIRRRVWLGVVGIALLVTALVQIRVIRKGGVLDLEQPSRIEALAHATMSPHFPDFVARVQSQSQGRAVAADLLFRTLLAWPLRDRHLTSSTRAGRNALRVTQSFGGEIVSCVWVPKWEKASVRQLLRYLFTQESFGGLSCQIGEIDP